MKKNILLITIMVILIAGYTSTAMAADLNVTISAPDTISANSDVNIDVLLHSQNNTRGFSMLVNIPELWDVSQWSVNGTNIPNNVIHQQAPEHLWHDGYVAYSWTFESPPDYLENNPIQENTNVTLDMVLKANNQDTDCQLFFDWFTSEPEDFGTFTIHFDVITSDGGSSNSGGGGGGGGTSGEAFENILISETEREYVNKNSEVSYSFDMEGNIIQYINFTGLTSSGQIASKVEILKNISTMVEHDPPDIVYKNLNIWVGNLGWATSSNIANPTIHFKVEKSWINEYNINEPTIKLNRYNSGIWNPLVTTKIGENAEYLYFESNTPGFSPFAVTGKILSADSGGEGILPRPTTSVEEPQVQVSTEKKPNIPGFSLFAVVFNLLILMFLLRKNK